MHAGAGQLFWSDVHSSLIHFQPMYEYMANDVVLSSDRRRLDTLPPQSRAKLLSVVAAFLPYYTPSAVRNCTCNEANIEYLQSKFMESLQ